MTNPELLAAVRDCMTYNLTEREALAYIKERTGEEITGRHYYRVKSFVESDPDSTQLWLSQFTKIGFVTEHRKHIDEVNKARSEMWQMIWQEQDKPPEQQNLMLIAKLYSQIEDNVRLASALNLGTPVVAQIKAMVDKANEQFNTLSYNKQDIQPRGLPEPESTEKDPDLY
jgi:hypothetical protein